MNDINIRACDDIKRAVEAGAQLVDVRSPQEFAAGALPGAINLPLQQVEYASEKLKSENAVLIYCLSGQRSELARQALDSMGFDNVSNIGAYEHYRNCH